MSEEEFERLAENVASFAGAARGGPEAERLAAEARRARIENEAKRLQIETLFRVRDELQERVETLKTEIAALRERAERAERGEDALVARLENFTAKIQAAEADRERLREDAQLMADWIDNHYDGAPDGCGHIGEEVCAAVERWRGTP